MIDINYHPLQIAEIIKQDPSLTQSAKDIMGIYYQPPRLELRLLQMDVAGVEKAVISALDCTTAHGCTIVSNEQIAWLMEQSSRFIGFASVDPHSPHAVKKLEKAVQEYGLSGLKLDPSLQQFHINDKVHAYPIYDKCVELNIPILMHCGNQWAPLGRASYGQPLMLEDVIHDFPKLRIIITQFGWPWVNEAVMLALKHNNIYLETSVLYSGTPWESLRHVLETTIGLNTVDRSLSQQVVFGSGAPRIDMKRAVWAVKELGLSLQLENKIFYENSQKLLNLEGRGKA